MGNARWDPQKFRQYSTSVSAKSADQIFRGRSIDEDLDPSKIRYRESVDSEANPNATPIILACDETGSMGVLAEEIIREGLGVIMGAIYTHKPVPDPHIMCMGIGDAYVDQAPLQVTQFEADVDALVPQVEKIYIEGNGGGNGGESYSLAWWFAMFKCKTDSYKRRSRKGFLFTIGDECPHPEITIEQVKKFLGVGCEEVIPTDKLLAMVQEHWHVFHLIVRPVSSQPVVDTWKGLLDERAIIVGDRIDKMSHIIVATISLIEGQGVNEVKSDMDQETLEVVEEATQKLLPASSSVDS
jgi:hypothetical protein